MRFVQVLSDMKVATLFTTSSVLTLSAWSNGSYLCQNMRPQSPLPALNSTDGMYCPITTGAFAFSSTIPWGRNRELTTLITRLRAVDPFNKELVCLDVFTTPLDPRPKSPYGKAEIIFWSTITLTLAYWIVVGIARISLAWGRGITRPGRGLWSRAQSAGYILASAISGEGFANAPALLRFCESSSVFHKNFIFIIFRYSLYERCNFPYPVVRNTCHGGSGVASVCLCVSVQLPHFIFSDAFTSDPLLTQTAWSTLSYSKLLLVLGLTPDLTSPQIFH
jgi:hypothetical protein